jgi:hypothetical protein
MTAPAPALCPREKEVTITIDPSGSIKVVPDTFHVSKGRHEEVVWTCNVPFTLDFVDSPFHDTHFDNQDTYSGLVRRDVPAGTGKSFKYSVSAGRHHVDPDGQVDQ